jgi:hypothetical protein
VSQCTRIALQQSRTLRSLVHDGRGRGTEHP